MDYLRQTVLSKMQSWVGKNEKDGSHKEIIDIYNTIKPLPRNYKVKYNDEWCAATVSAVFHAVGYDSIFPSECGCQKMVDKATKMGIWKEDDDFMPSAGDCILYDWQDDGKGDDTGYADHVGMIEKTDANYLYTIEGNWDDAVSRRKIKRNSKTIRGFVCPKFTASTLPVPAPKSIDELAKEVMSGVWGNGDARKKALKSSGYNYYDVQARVHQLVYASNRPIIRATKVPSRFDESVAGEYVVTNCTALYVRNGGGSAYATMCALPKGTVVTNFGYYDVVGTTKWFYIAVVYKGNYYIGYCSGAYLKH